MEPQSASMPVRVLNVNQIMDAIPHRFPFLLIDRLEILEEGKRATAYKGVTMNEQFFQGHFPGHPIMPGVLIVEAMAQAACALMFSQPSFKNKLAFFMSMEDIKFRKPVTPGCLLRLDVEMLRMGSRAGKAKGVGLVDGEITTEATFSFAVTDRT